MVLAGGFFVILIAQRVGNASDFESVVVLGKL